MSDATEETGDFDRAIDRALAATRESRRREQDRSAETLRRARDMREERDRLARRSP